MRGFTENEFNTLIPGITAGKDPCRIAVPSEVDGEEWGAGKN